MDITGLGPAVIDELVDKKIVSDYGDLYAIKGANWLAFSKIGDKSAANLDHALNQSKKRPYDRLLNALGIPGVGSATARSLAKNFPTIDKLAAATLPELTAIDGIGETNGIGIMSFFANARNREAIEKLRAAGVCMEYREVEDVPKILDGKIFVITGAIPGVSRLEAAATILKYGGTVSESVSKQTSFLVTEDVSARSSKIDKALELGTKIISWKELALMCGFEPPEPEPERQFSLFDDLGKNKEEELAARQKRNAAEKSLKAETKNDNNNEETQGDLFSDLF